MAINLETQYPGKVNPSDSDYPYGSARNVTVPGDGTGTPWEAAFVNDLVGFQQAMLQDAGIVPSGTPDKATLSQYLQALYNAVNQRHDRTVTVAEMTAITAPELRTNMRFVVSDRDNGVFEVVTGETSNGWDVIDHDTLAFQFKLIVDENTNIAMFGAIGDGVTLEDTLFVAAKARCKLEGYPLTLVGGKVYDLGSISFDVNILREVINTTGGVAVLKATSAPTGYFCRLVGEYTRGSGPDYTDRHLANHDVLKDVALMGNESIPYSVNGLEIGDGTLVTSLFSTDNVHISGFRFWGEFKDNSWAFKLKNLHTKHGGLKTPASPVDYGENISFITPFIADSVGEIMQFNRGEYTIFGGSIDNIEIETNNDATVKWDKGHLENPGSSSTTTTYVTCNDQSAFIAPGLEIVINDPGANITEPWFFCEDGNPNGIDLTGCIYSQQSYYRPDLGSQARIELVGGGGKVQCSHANVNAFSNFVYVPVGHKVVGGLVNGDFEAGFAVSWVTSGTASFVNDTVIFKTGTQALKIVASPTNNGTVKNRIPCREGQKLTGGYWRKGELADGGNVQAQVDFLDRNGAVLSTVSFVSDTATFDWEWSRVGGVAPEGAVEAEVTLQTLFTGVSGSVTGWFDGVILNAL